MGAVKYQIFISSTFKDLQEERRVLSEQILNLGHIPVGMELFQAANDSQWNYIKKRIVSCDYYLLIVAERYGAVGADGKSFTRKEYEFAVENGIPVAAFLLDDRARGSRLAEHVEQNRKAEIDEFRTVCSSSKMVNFWSNSGDLALKATNALLGLIEDEPRHGWVRADESADSALRELAKLAEEKRDLESRINELVISSQSYVSDEEYISIVDRLKKVKIFDGKIVLYDLLIQIGSELKFWITEDDLKAFIWEACDVKFTRLQKLAKKIFYDTDIYRGAGQLFIQKEIDLVREAVGFFGTLRVVDTRVVSISHRAVSQFMFSNVGRMIYRREKLNIE